MFTRILMPSDGSSVAGLAAETAIELARACGASIVALSIAVPEAPPLTEGGMVPNPGHQTDAMLEQAHGVVEALASAARRAGVECIQVTRVARNAAKAIAVVAQEYRCDLIVMGSHGRRGLSRLLAGSVTQEVLADAPVPVMVFRPARRVDQARASEPAGAAGDRA